MPLLIINTFLESYDFSGKTIVPFATSGGSDMGKTSDALKTCCSKDTIGESGKRFTTFDEAEFKNWIDSLLFNKSCRQFRRQQYDFKLNI